MTYMEIATYLGMFSAMISNELQNDPDHNPVMDKTREAIMEAQLIMYEMARQEMRNDAE